MTKYIHFPHHIFCLTIKKNGDIIIKLSDERSGTEKEIENVFGLRKVKFAEIFDFLKKVLDKTADK